MKHCEFCNVNVATKTTTCPLCKNILKEDDESEHLTYPAYVELKGKNNIRTKVFFFVSLVAIAVCVMANFMLGIEKLWCIAAGMGILYLWFLIEFTFLSKANLGVKLLLNAICISALIIMINSTLTEDVGEMITAPTWALTYVLPFVLVAFTLTITITIGITKMKWRDYTLYLFSIIVLSFLPLILALALQLNPAWPSYAAAAYSLLTFIAMFLFMDKRTKNEFRKRFHI